MEFYHSTIIQTHHCDHYGHMNNASYMQLYEEARWAMLKAKNWDQGRIEIEGYGPIVLEAQIWYRRELKVKEEIRIRVETLDSTRKVFEIHQNMTTNEGMVASEARFKLGLMDLRQRRLIQPPRAWVEAF